MPPILFRIGGMGKYIGAHQKEYTKRVTLFSPTIEIQSYSEKRQLKTEQIKQKSSAGNSLQLFAFVNRIRTSFNWVTLPFFIYCHTIRYYKNCQILLQNLIHS